MHLMWLPALEVTCAEDGQRWGRTGTPSCVAPAMLSMRACAMLILASLHAAIYPACGKTAAGDAYLLFCAAQARWHCHRAPSQLISE